MAETYVKNLFIDANIWLSLFHYTSDDLEEFKKLRARIGTEIKLFVPEQIYDEVYRNRENKLKDALEKFERFDLSFPVFIKNYEEYKEFYRQFSDLKKQHRDWLKKVKEDIAEQRSPADVVLNDFFESIELLPSTPDLVQKGVLRYNIGNPPGKDKKYGDAINWETLLEHVPDGEDLFFVSADKDYASIYNDKQFHPFLAQEWEKKKHAKDIELQAESEKDNLIDELSHSGSFATTHRIIKDLKKHSDWSLRQIQDMCNAAINNHQINWILSDSDIFYFYMMLLEAVSDAEQKDRSIAMVSEELANIAADRAADQEPEFPDWML